MVDSATKRERLTVIAAMRAEANRFLSLTPHDEIKVHVRIAIRHLDLVVMWLNHEGCCLLEADEDMFAAQAELAHVAQAMQRYRPSVNESRPNRATQNRTPTATRHCPSSA